MNCNYLKLKKLISCPVKRLNTGFYLQTVRMGFKKFYRFRINKKCLLRRYNRHCWLVVLCFNTVGGLCPTSWGHIACYVSFGSLLPPLEAYWTQSESPPELMANCFAVTASWILCTAWGLCCTSIKKILISKDEIDHLIIFKWNGSFRAADDIGWEVL